MNKLGKECQFPQSSPEWLHFRKTIMRTGTSSKSLPSIIDGILEEEVNTFHGRDAEYGKKTENDFVEGLIESGIEVKRLSTIIPDWSQSAPIELGDDTYELIQFGLSPDGIIMNNDGVVVGLEIKAFQPKHFIEIFLSLKKNEIESHFQDAVMKIAQENPSIVDEISGLGPAKYKKICDGFGDAAQIEKVATHLGITSPLKSGEFTSVMKNNFSGREFQKIGGKEITNQCLSYFLIGCTHVQLVLISPIEELSDIVVNWSIIDHKDDISTLKGEIDRQWEQLLIDCRIIGLLTERPKPVIIQTYPVTQPHANVE